MKSCKLILNAFYPRFESFAPERLGTAKWFVDGCDYLAAVGGAIAKVITNLAQTRPLITLARGFYFALHFRHKLTSNYAFHL